MSWSIQIAGKAAALPDKVKAAFDQYRCGENFPVEQAIKDGIRDLIVKALSGSEPNRAYKIDASGSAGNTYTPATPEVPAQYAESQQSFRFSMEELYNFVE